MALAQLLAMALWFSASALVPQLSEVWGLSGAGQSWLTMSVQLGFVAGAILSALLNLPDRFPTERVIAFGMLAGAIANSAVTFADTAAVAIALRFVTGASLALVYPPGMKMVASWCREDRGFGIGLLVGALTIGSGMPHLVSAVPVFAAEGGLPAWQTVMWVTSGQAFVAAIIAIGFLRSGPHLARASVFSWRQATEGLTRQPPRLANLGYFGHMWELYGMWTWVPIALLWSFDQAGWSPQGARLTAFSVMAVGGISAVIAGKWADRVGRTRITAWAMAVSGACAVVAGFTVNQPAIFVVVVLVWGFAVIADSAQFSAAVSELADPAYVGTALTVQTSIGFLLTIVSIRLVSIVQASAGWGWAFALLAVGPLVGVVAMRRLRKLPESRRMAGGRR